ncbi:hypothetical protein STA3757_38920 [Stanieria sp. NIES-3757]|nr:hypothetical protein STA3757_38920 [Stanieria sp. NIES-3757]
MINKLPLLIGLFVLLLEPTVVQAQTENQRFINKDNNFSLSYKSNFTNFKIPKQSRFDLAKEFLVTNQFHLNSLRLSRTAIQSKSTHNFATIAQLTTKKPITTSEKNTTQSSTLAEAEFVKYKTTSESLDSVITPENSLSQVTDVSQLRDVQPGDWAYEALRGLVERYGCIAGYPNQTYRGTQALSRYEFAAGLNSCLQQIERLIASSEAVVQEDIATIKRLTEEFEAELATISGRVDNLENKVAFLEDHQFSTTTTLNGEVIFAIADAFGGDPPGGCSIVDPTQDGRNLGADCVNRGEPETNTVFTHLTRLGLQTSFTGQDRLRMYLTTGNFSDGGFTNPESLNTYMARLGYQADYDNEINLDILEYRLPAFNDKVVFYASTFGFGLSNVLTANSPYFDIGRGAVSRFGQLNPILRIGGAMDAGVGFDWAIAEPLRFQVAYGTRDSGDPEGGFFGSDYSALGAQFLVQPTDNIVAGINYVNAYSSDGSLGTYTGSVNAETGGLWSDARVPSPASEQNDPTFADCCRFFLGDQPAQINAVGGSFQWNVTEKLNLAAWGGYTFANFLNELPDFPETEVDGTPPEDGIGASANKKPFANTATFTLSLGLSDPFGREGDLFGFIFGMPPKLVDAGPETAGTPVPFFEQVINNEEETVVTDNNPNLDTVGEVIAADGDAPGLVREGQLPRRVGQKDEATSLHFEFFYRFKVNDSISITPGFYFVTNPGHIENNDTIYVGTIRTTYRF